MNINHNHILSLMQTGFTTIGVVYEVDSSTATAVERARNRSKRRICCTKRQWNRVSLRSTPACSST